MDSPGLPPVSLAPLDARVRWLWLGSSVAFALSVTAGVGALDLAGMWPQPRGLATLLVLLVSVAAAVAWSQVRYERWRFALREHDLWIRHGVIWVRVSVIPLSRLQFVDTRQGPLHRLFGLAEVIVHTAAVGTSGTVPGLDAQQAERLREQLAHMASAAQPV